MISSGEIELLSPQAFDLSQDGFRYDYEQLMSIYSMFFHMKIMPHDGGALDQRREVIDGLYLLRSFVENQKLALRQKPTLMDTMTDDEYIKVYEDYLDGFVREGASPAAIQRMEEIQMVVDKYRLTGILSGDTTHDPSS